MALASVKYLLHHKKYKAMAKKKGSSLESKKRQKAALAQKLRDLKASKKIDSDIKRLQNQIGAVSGSKGTRKGRR